VFCERFTEQSDIWNLARHEHHYVEILYFLEGGARVHGDASDLTISVFDPVIYPENAAHLEVVDLSQHQEVICLGIELPGPSGLKRIRRLSDLDASLRWLFVELHTQAQSDYTQRDALVGHLLQSLLHVTRQALDAAADIQDPISRVVHYLHENISHGITVGELANVANCSPSYLDRRFKDRTGETPMKYLERVRMEAARRLLERGDLAVADVASLIGFADAKYFSRRFAARFGAPPSRFRKRVAPKSTQRPAASTEPV
jgi:AraC-like DNA-binding protein